MWNCVKVLNISFPLNISFSLVEAVFCFTQQKMVICDALRDLVPFVQFEKRERHPWRSDTFSGVVGY